MTNGLSPTGILRHRSHHYFCIHASLPSMTTESAGRVSTRNPSHLPYPLPLSPIPFRASDWRRYRNHPLGTHQRQNDTLALCSNFIMNDVASRLHPKHRSIGSNISICSKFQQQIISTLHIWYSLRIIFHQPSISLQKVKLSYTWARPSTQFLVEGLFNTSIRVAVGNKMGNPQTQSA